MGSHCFKKPVMGVVHIIFFAMQFDEPRDFKIMRMTKSGEEVMSKMSVEAACDPIKKA